VNAPELVVFEVEEDEVVAVPVEVGTFEEVMEEVELVPFAYAGAATDP